MCECMLSLSLSCARARARTHTHTHTHAYVYTVLFSSKKHFCNWWNAKNEKKKHSVLVSQFSGFRSGSKNSSMCVCVCVCECLSFMKDQCSPYPLTNDEYSTAVIQNVTPSLPLHFVRLLRYLKEYLSLILTDNTNPKHFQNLSSR